MNAVFTWASELVPLASALCAFIYGVRNFFKSGIALYLQSITMAMGCHALGSLYHVCEMLTKESVSGGFTPAYLGNMGFYLFFIAASYGQLDRIVDDGSEKMRPARYKGLFAPAGAGLICIPNFISEEISVGTVISCVMLWIPAAICVYFSLKHAIIPDMDFGFIKAIKPYNTIVTALVFSDLLCMTARNSFPDGIRVIFSIIFGILSFATIIAAKKGVEKWTI